MSNQKKIRETPKILIVDDRATERNILSKLLSKFDVEIHTADSGQAALSKLIRHSYVLVLLDIQMPIMDGIETAKIMRGNSLTENIPIIFLTAYDKDEINMLQGYKVGAIDYLFKPINPEILSSKVDTFLRSYSFEKEKEYEKILSELENKNRKLKKAKSEALGMMEDANKAKAEAQDSQKQLEEQAKELLRYTKELEQFAYVATHDLRAPIINLNGFMEIFRKRGYVNDENQGIVKRIEASVERINTTLHDLIQVVASRKTLEEDIREVDFNQILKEVKKDLAPQIGEAGATIRADFKKAPTLNYIPGHLRSIIQNLLTNSIKYHNPGQRPVVDVSTQQVGDKLCLTVSDNGIGIDETKKEKVFGLFQRLSNITPGSGMGLYITKSQVESMGGSIDFSSQPEEGTEFKVLLKDLSKNKIASNE